jgi:hypothetical protein
MRPKEDLPFATSLVRAWFGNVQGLVWDEVVLDMQKSTV